MNAKPRLLITMILTLALPGSGSLAVAAEKALERDTIGFPSYGPIADADPAKREEREVLVPAGFKTFRTAEELVICENAGPLKSVKFKVGHKMILGMNTKLYVYKEGTERPATPQMESLGGTRHRISNLPTMTHLTEPFGFVQREQSYVIEWEVVIFETDIPPQHMWMIESDKYKVLWQATYKNIPKEERELPPELLEIKARNAHIKAAPVPMPDIPDDFLRTTSDGWKRTLATEITAGFKLAPFESVVKHLSKGARADIVLKLRETDPAKLRPILRGFDHRPLRTALYEICQDTGLIAEWELEEGAPVRIVITEQRP